MRRSALLLLTVLAIAIGTSQSSEGASVTYEHDTRGRLTRATYDDGTVVDYSYDADGNRTGESVAPGIDNTAPTVPGSLTATPISQTQINVSWAASADNIAVTGYRLQRCTGETCTTFAQIATQSSTSYSDTGRSAGTTYRYRVSAYDSLQNESAFSNPVNATTLDTIAPGAPGTPTFSSITMTSARASWAAAADNVDVTGYQYRINSGSWQLLGNVLLVDLSGLSAATSYTFDVRARDAADNFGPSQSNTFTTPDTEGPIAPGAPTYSDITQTSATASWTAATDNVGVVDYDYRINAGAWQSSGGALSANLTGLVAATTYIVQVRARDAAGNFGPASGSSFSISDATPPSEPGTLSFSSITMTSATVTWAAATDNVEVTGYEYRLDAGSWVSLVDVLSVNLTGLSAATSYTVQVRARDGANNIGNARSGTLTTIDTAVPSAPGTPTFTNVTMTSARAHWPLATDNVSVTGYEYQLNSGSWQSRANIPPLDLTGLAAATTYTFAVRARDGANNVGSVSSAVFTTPDTQAPSTPTGLGATAPSSTRVNLSWNAATDNVAVTGYKIFRNGGQIGTSASTSYADTAVSGSTSYSYRVSAYDNAGNNSGQSTAVSVTTPDTIAPSTPSGLAGVAVSPTQVNLTWNAASDSGGSGLAGYRIYRSGVQVATRSVTNYSDTGRTPGTNYSYSVRAYDNASNLSSHSNTVSVTTLPPLQATVSATSWRWRQIENRPPVVPANIVVTATGGVPGYTYLWQRISGDTQTTVTSATSSSTGWSRPTSLGEYTSVWRCRVTDSTGSTAYTPNVTVIFHKE